MTRIEQMKLLAHIVRWRLTWSRHDATYLPAELASPKFVSAQQAAARIADKSTVLSCGMAGNARCSIFFWAIRERFLRENHPRGLTWVNVGAQGGRGKAPGTVEELALVGLIQRYITGHLETAKALLRLADAGQVELYTLPQGQMAQLLAGQGRGETSQRATVGLGTFLDPRRGRGSAVTPQATNDYISADGDALIYRLPLIEVCLFNAPYADSEGNIYFRDAATITENVPGAAAARRNGGLVMAAVSSIVPKDERTISLRADQVDCIVVNPRNEQTGSVPQRRFWPMFTVGAQVDEADAVERLKFANKVLRITPVRSAADDALARLAATLFVRIVPPGGIANVGVGFPEEVARVVIGQGLGHRYTFTTETGVYGGLPAPGIFFGAAINPTRMEPSSWMFDLYAERLAVAVLGFLQVDAAGNVNVSKRGPRMVDYVGPGGFPDIAAGAKTVIFVGSWMADAQFTVDKGAMQIKQRGKPKFVGAVDEITLSGAEALRQGKQIYFVTQVGVMQLTAQGLTLVEVMPGIDITRDILSNQAPRIVLPQGGAPVADARVVTGAGYTLAG
jgi:propionate CoA-transferase